MLFDYIATKLDAINFNGANSALDYHLIMKSKSIGEAGINEIRETVPHMNGDYDFTGKFAPISYQNRKIKVAFMLFMDSENDLWRRKSEIISWLTSQRGGTLAFDSIPDYIFKKCSCVVKSFKQEKRDTRYATLEIEITCSPYVQIKNGEKVSTLISYSGDIDFLFYYKRGSSTFTATNQTENTIAFRRPGGMQYLVTMSSIDLAMPSIIDLSGNSQANVVYHSRSDEITLTKLGEKTIDNTYHSYWRYDPIRDSDDDISSAYLLAAGSQGATGLSATMYNCDVIEPDSELEILLYDKNGEIGPLNTASLSVLRTADLGGGDLKLEQKAAVEVLI